MAPGFHGLPKVLKSIWCMVHSPKSNGTTENGWFGDLYFPFGATCLYLGPATWNLFAELTAIRHIGVPTFARNFHEENSRLLVMCPSNSPWVPQQHRHCPGQKATNHGGQQDVLKVRSANWLIDALGCWIPSSPGIEVWMLAYCRIWWLDVHNIHNLQTSGSYRITIFFPTLAQESSLTN